MKINQFVPAIFLLLALVACQGDKGGQSSENNDPQAPNAEKETPQKMLETLIGDWELENGGAQAGGHSRITFTNEARYIAFSGNQKVDSGAYRMNEQLRNLYFESEANEQPREFEVELQGDRLTLTPRQGQNQGGEGQSGPMTYRRVSGGTRQPNQ